MFVYGLIKFFKKGQVFFFVFVYFVVVSLVFIYVDCVNQKEFDFCFCINNVGYIGEVVVGLIYFIENVNIFRDLKGRVLIVVELKFNVIIRVIILR